MSVTMGTAYRGNRERLLIFSDSNSVAAAALVPAFLRALRRRHDVECVAVCDTARGAPRGSGAMAAHAWGRALARWIIGPHRPGLPYTPPWRDVRGYARRYGVPLLDPPQRNINHPDFLERLRTREKPTLALSLICMQIFREDLLACFEYGVNYHDGLLPDYKGLLATPWSIYNGEPYSGYSFHRLTRDIDAGPVVLEGKREVTPGSRRETVAAWKTADACRRAGEVLERMVRRDPGRPQAGPGRYYSGKKGAEWMTIGDPGALTSAELEKRLRAFGTLSLWIAGRPRRVTALRKARRADAPLAFCTADGVLMEPFRLYWLPPALDGLYRRFQPAHRREGELAGSG